MMIVYSSEIKHPIQDSKIIILKLIYLMYNWPQLSTLYIISILRWLVGSKLYQSQSISQQIEQRKLRPMSSFCFCLSPTAPRGSRGTRVSNKHGESKHKGGREGSILKNIGELHMDSYISNGERAPPILETSRDSTPAGQLHSADAIFNVDCHPNRAEQPAKIIPQKIEVQPIDVKESEEIHLDLKSDEEESKNEATKQGQIQDQIKVEGELKLRVEKLEAPSKGEQGAKDCGELQEKQGKLKDQQPKKSSANLSGVIYASKVMHYQCQGCLKHFQKVLISDINIVSEAKKIPTLNALQDLFNINDVVKCPYCMQLINQLLTSKMFVGNSEEMEKYDFANKENALQQQLELIESVTNEGDTSCKNMYTPRTPDDPQYNFNQFPSVIGGADLNDKESDEDKAPLPSVLHHKYQQLKDPKKYAQMIYLTSHQVNGPFSMTAKQFDSSEDCKAGGSSNNLLALGSTEVSNGGGAENHHPNLPHQLQFKSKTLPLAAIQEQAILQASKYPTPDMHNVVDEEACKKFNSELMRIMMNKKTKKALLYSDFIQGKTSSKPSHDLLANPCYRAVQKADEKVVDAIHFDFFAKIEDQKFSSSNNLIIQQSEL